MVDRSGDFLQRIQQQAPRLPRQMRRLAEFVCANYQQVAFLTTRALAKDAGVSLATVVRFPVLLGFKDFAAFRRSIQDRVNFDLTGVERLVPSLAVRRGKVDVLHRIVTTEMANLKSLLRTVDRREFDAVVDLLATVPAVAVVGLRYLAPMCEYFGYSLRKVRVGVDTVTAADSTVFDRLGMMDKATLLVALGMARYPADLLPILTLGRDRGMGVVSITDSPISPLVPLSDRVLLAPSELRDFVGSFAAPACLINALVSAVGVRRGRAAVRQLEHLERIATTRRIYVTGTPRTRPRRNVD